MKNKIKSVLIVSDFYPDHNNNEPGGGIARYNEFLASGLAKKGYKTTVLTLGNFKSKKIENGVEIHMLSTKILDDFVGRFHKRIPKLKYYRYKLRALYLKVYYVFKLKFRDFDIIEFSDINFPGFYFEKKLTNVIRLHGNYNTNYKIYEDDLSEANKKTWKSMTQFEKKYFQKINNFTFMAHFFKNYFLDLNIVQNINTAVIYNPVDIEEFTFKENNNSEFTIVTTDRLERRKGMDMVLKLINLLIENYDGQKKIRFKILGDNRLSDSSNLLKYNTSPNENVQFEFFGNTPKKELIRIIQNADLFIGPSRFESFSYSLFEAMSCGIPALVANDHVYPEMVKEDFNGWIYEQDNLEDMLSGFYKALNLDDSTLKNFGNNARTFVEKNAAIDIIIDKTVAFYQEILNDVN